MIDKFESMGYKGRRLNEKVKEEIKNQQMRHPALKRVPMCSTIRAPCAIHTSHVPIVGCTESGRMVSQATEPAPCPIVRRPVTGRGRMDKIDPINNVYSDAEMVAFTQKARNDKIDAIIQESEDYYSGRMVPRPTVINFVKKP